MSGDSLIRTISRNVSTRPTRYHDSGELDTEVDTAPPLEVDLSVPFTAIGASMLRRTKSPCPTDAATENGSSCPVSPSAPRSWYTTGGMWRRRRREAARPAAVAARPAAVCVPLSPLLPLSLLLPLLLPLPASPSFKNVSSASFPGTLSSSATIAARSSSSPFIFAFIFARSVATQSTKYIRSTSDIAFTSPSTVRARSKCCRRSHSLRPPAPNP